MRLKWPHVCVAALVTLLVLFGGQMLYKTYAVAKPIANIEQIQGVKNVNWIDATGKNGVVTIEVEADYVDNLPKFNTQIETIAKSVLGSKPYKITFIDTRNSELESLYHEVHYYIQEGIFTGDFSQMVTNIQVKAQASGVSADIYVDAEKVYLTLNKAGAQLISVEPRARR